nr:hypothetical protein [Tanacetum cinerariifolium]
GKDSSNPLMADNLPKIVWYSTYHVALIKSWIVQKQMALGVNTPRCDEDMLELMELTVFLLPKFWTTVAVKKVNDITRLQALVYKKKVVVTEATIRDDLHLDDAEGVECLPNEEIFVELARMAYEKPFTKLTFYKAFISSQYKFLIHTILQCMSAKRKSWNEFSSLMASAVICLSSGKGFSGVETQLFEGMIVEQQVAEGVADEVHGEDVTAVGVVTAWVVSAANDALEITKLKQRIKKLEKRNKVKVLKLRRLKRVGSAQRIDTSNETVMDDVSNQGRMIANMDANADVVLEEAKEVVADAKDGQDADVEENVLSMQEEELEPIELQEVVDIVTTAKIIAEVVTVASTTITAADVPIPAATTAAAPKLTVVPSRRTKGVVIRDPEESTTTSIIIHSEAKYKDKAQARKNMMVYLKNVAGFKMNYFKGMYYDDIRPFFEKYIDSNVAFLQKTKEQMDEEDSRALKRLNESKEEKAAKSRS